MYLIERFIITSLRYKFINQRAFFKTQCQTSEKSKMHYTNMASFLNKLNIIRSVGETPHIWPFLKYNVLRGPEGAE